MSDQKNYRKRFEQLKDLVNDCEADADDFFIKKNKSASKRLRAKLLDVGKLTKDVRKDIMDAVHEMKKK